MSAVKFQLLLDHPSEVKDFTSVKEGMKAYYAFKEADATLPKRKKRNPKAWNTRSNPLSKLFGGSR